MVISLPSWNSTGALDDPQQPSPVPDTRKNPAKSPILKDKIIHALFPRSSPPQMCTYRGGRLRDVCIVEAITNKRQWRLRNETRASQNHSIPSESHDEAPWSPNLPEQGITFQRSCLSWTQLARSWSPASRECPGSTREELRRTHVHGPQGPMITPPQDPPGGRGGEGGGGREEEDAEEERGRVEWGWWEGRK